MSCLWNNFDSITSILGLTSTLVSFFVVLSISKKQTKTIFHVNRAVVSRWSADRKLRLSMLRLSGLRRVPSTEAPSSVSPLAFIRSTLKKKIRFYKKKTNNARRRRTHVHATKVSERGRSRRQRLRVCCQSLVVTRGARTAYIKSKSSEGLFFSSEHQSRRSRVDVLARRRFVWDFVTL